MHVQGHLKLSLQQLQHQCSKLLGTRQTELVSADANKHKRASESTCIAFLLAVSAVYKLHTNLVMLVVNVTTVMLQPNASHDASKGVKQRCSEQCKQGHQSKLFAKPAICCTRLQPQLLGHVLRAENPPKDVSGATTSNE